MIAAVLGVLILALSFVAVGLNKRTPESVNLGVWAWVARALGVLMIVGGVLVDSVVMVPAGHRAVKLQFGAVRGILTEGIHLIVPFVNTTELIEVRTQKEESQASAASKDLQIVTTILALNFHVDPMRVDELYQKVGREYVERIIDPAVQESLKVVTASYTAEELVKFRSRVKDEVQLEITERLAVYNVTVEPNGLSIVNFDFSPEFNKAIEEKQVAQQQAEKQKYVLQQAELEKQTQITRAEGAAQAAKLSAAALQAQGGGLVIAREWIEKWNGEVPSVSAGAGQNVILDVSSLMRTPAR
ncbi:MAG: prohibitin family protein [Armatimonadota bacterium]|nr:prohibitin family protein [Armatimonadota bacterium]